MTGSLHNTIQQLATDFAAGVLGAIRGSSLEDILAETEGAKRRGPGRPRKQSVAAAPERAASRPSSARRKGGRLGRRSAGALERVVGRIVDLLSRNSKGLRAEQIRAELGLSAKELPRPIGKALESKRIRKTGQKRATTYFTGGGGAAKPAAGGKKARRGRPPGKKGRAASKKRAGKKAGAPAAAAAPAAS
jgi:hypothetical protein